MARISTHVLDIARGRPAAGIAVSLTSAGHPGAFATTNADGRTDAPLVSEPELQWAAMLVEGLTLLLLAPHAYSTYRGS